MAGSITWEGIAQRRCAAGLTASHLASAVGIPRPRYSLLENGHQQDDEAKHNAHLYVLYVEAAQREARKRIAGAL